MRVLIAGVDGYLGWPLAQHLAAQGHRVTGIDCGLRRKLVAGLGSCSALPISTMPRRWRAFRERFGATHTFRNVDLMAYDALRDALEKSSPDAIVHLAELPSAPYSMRDVRTCALTQSNNILGTLNLLWAMKETCPKAHLVKLGTMGEYGTPNIDIPEGFFEVRYRGRRDTLPFPRQAGSWYHQSKVHDSNNIMLACKIWGLRSTDIMQGVVYGTRTCDMSGGVEFRTRFDFDQCFGTAINRFCAQAVIRSPITPFGKGLHSRGFLPLRDSMACLTLAIRNPPEPGEYRVFNQFEDTYTIGELANRVKAAADEFGLSAVVRCIENPRIEAPKHYYRPDRKKLIELGYRPTSDMMAELREMLTDLLPFVERIRHRKNSLRPDIRWDGSRETCRSL